MDIKLQQTQKLAPQMVQSLKILQMPAIDLVSLVKHEIENNPLFKFPDNDHINLHESPPYSSDVGTTYSNKINSSYTDNKTAWLENIPSETTLQDFLLQQVVDIDDDLKAQLLILIGSLDDNGFLPNIKITKDNKTAYELLLSLEPKGIGQKNLKECLLSQIPKNSVLYKIVDKHFDNLQKYRYSKIQRSLGLSRTELILQIKNLQKYNFYPAKLFSSNNSNIIIPEIFFKKIEGEWKFSLSKFAPVFNEDFYHSTIKSLNKEDRIFFTYNKQRAQNLLNSLEFRNNTLTKVVQFILDNQQQFFELGPEYLRPFTLKDTAQILELCPSTLTRSIANKYAQTPYGIFGLKYFFSSGIGGISKHGIIKRIKSLIDKENKKKPLTDGQLAEILNNSGIFIARRTVAKYREELKILPARTRKIV